jgi:methyl coenzyme M reductase subunit D
MSPAFFNTYMVAIKEIEERRIKGIKVNGEEINILCFADDIAIVAGSEDDLRNSLNTIEKVFHEYNMKINKKKTKVPMCRRKKTVADIHLKGERLERLESFTFLGITITWDGRSTSDIKRRIVQAKTAFMAKRALLCSKSIRL